MGRTSWDLQADIDAEQRSVRERGAALTITKALSDTKFEDALEILEVPLRFLDSIEDLRNWIKVNHMNNGN